MVCYDLGGIKYEKSIGLSSAEYAEYAIGSQIELVYKPGNPKRSMRADAMSRKGLTALFVIGLCKYDYTYF